MNSGAGCILKFDVHNDPAISCILHRNNDKTVIICTRCVRSIISVIDTICETPIGPYTVFHREPVVMHQTKIPRIGPVSGIGNDLLLFQRNSKL